LDTSKRALTGEGIVEYFGSDRVMQALEYFGLVAQQMSIQKAQLIEENFEKIRLIFKSGVFFQLCWRHYRRESSLKALTNIEKFA